MLLAQMPYHLSSQRFASIDGPPIADFEGALLARQNSPPAEEVQSTAAEARPILTAAEQEWELAQAASAPPASAGQPSIGAIELQLLLPLQDEQQSSLEQG